MEERIQQIRVRGEGPGLDATIEQIRAAGICGCGREHPHGGRCAWKREHGKRRNGSSGAEVAGGGQPNRGDQASEDGNRIGKESAPGCFEASAGACGIAGGIRSSELSFLGGAHAQRD